MLLALVFLGSCRTENTDGVAIPEPRELFADATASSGLDFVHFNGMTGERYIVEMMGSGGALFDYDNDGDLDLWLRQGTALDPDAREAAYRDRLFRNDLQDSGAVVFQDVTDTTGIEVRDYGMGIATGDYDDDGWVDLYLTNFGANRLLRNRGAGTFEDVTSGSGTADDRWSAPAVFADFDGDGRLDLYIGNYVDFSLANHRPCHESSAIDYCGPLSFQPQPDRLLRNRGDGTFEDVTARSGLAGSYGNALGGLARDFTGDGRIDLFVANDAMENQLWINAGDGTFREDALFRGCAVNGAGKREGSMGVSGGDIDGDGDLDLFITHLAAETNTLYLNDGRGVFTDGTLVAGLATPSRGFTGFGTSWLDYDNDGWLDLLAGNGEVKVIHEQERAGDPFPLRQTNQLFHNRGDGTFEDVSLAAGKAFELSAVTRGVIFGDVDNDGDTDVITVNNNGPARLLLNLTGQERHWLGVRLVGAEGGSAVEATRLELFRDAQPPLVRWAGSGGSYLSAHDPRVLFGLGARPQVTHLRVHWPRGPAEEYAVEAVDRYLTLVEGQGR